MDKKGTGGMDTDKFFSNKEAFERYQLAASKYAKYPPQYKIVYKR